MTGLPRLLRYAMTGGVAAVVDLAGFVLLQAAGLGLAAAAAGSFAVAALVNFTLTARFVFAADRTFQRLGLFLAFALAGLAINTAVTVAVGAGLAWPGWIAKCCGIGVAFGFNYLANARLVFAPRPR